MNQTGKEEGLAILTESKDDPTILTGSEDDPAILTPVPMVLFLTSLILMDSLIIYKLYRNTSDNLEPIHVFKLNW